MSSLAAARNTGANRCVHELIEAQASAAPDTVALLDAGRSVTYRVLNGNANCIARTLRNHGAGPESIVGVWGDRSIESVAALLGVLKVGAAYVAIDPRDPPERTRYVVANSGIRHVLTTGSAAAAERLDGLRELPVDRCRSARADVPNLVSPAVLDNLSMVIYTSGSSGQPKGVALTHRNVVSRLRGATAYVPTEPRLQKTRWSLIGHISDLLTPLVYGSTTILIGDDISSNVRALARAIRRYGVHRLFLVPSLLRILVDDPEAQVLSRVLSTVIVGGESLPAALASRFKARFPETNLINAYGLTETAGTVCSRVVSGNGEIVVGRPRADGVLEILTEELARTERGAVGEICIAGQAVARSYVNNPSLTAERFRPNPFGRPGSRLYMTGDLGRYRDDGAVEIVGRNDDEVQLHGHRINVADVEAVLESDSRVERACVLLARTEHGDGVLRGFLTVRDETGTLNARDLRNRIRKTLPRHTAPGSYCVVDSMPFLPNGKLDRQHLLQLRPDQLTVLADGDREGDLQLSTATETGVTRIWSRMFGVAAGETHRTFFELGGDSISAVRLALDIEDAFDVQLRVADIIENPTIGRLSEVIAAKRLQNSNGPTARDGR